MNAIEFCKLKGSGHVISMTTCYDFWTARILNQSRIDSILVGDSAAMVVHGHDSTLPATPEIMALHVAAVSRGAPDKFVIGDMPFGSYRKGFVPAMECVELLMRAGARAVKLEGVTGHEAIIENIVESGVPVMGHLGLTPQAIHQLGGFRVQATDEAAGEVLVADAVRLQDLGCFGLVLECVPSRLAARVTRQVSVPTIGIGAGVDVDGQVLVLQDLTGMNPDFTPRFSRTFMNGFEAMRDAVDAFDAAVKSRAYPTPEESYE